MSLPSNPYEVAYDLSAVTTELHRRSGFWRAVIAVQILAYAAYIAVTLFVALFTAFMGFGTARTDERLLLCLMLLAAPIVAWLFMMELMTWHSENPNRERLLAGFSVLFSAVPLVMSAFYCYEYIAFGAFELNAVPCMISLGVGGIWAWAATRRFRRTQRVGANDGLE